MKLRKIAKKYHAVKVASVTALIVGSSSAMAALPAGISAELSSVQTDGLALADLVWPVVIALFGSLLMFKLFKRFGSKI
jgi:hypothetical protein